MDYHVFIPRSNCPAIFAGAVTYDAASSAVFAAASVQPDATRKAVIDTLITGLKAAGLWPLIDVFYAGGADSQISGLNWKNPGTDTLLPSNSPTFTADRGFTGDDATMLLTGVSNLSAFSNFSQDSAHFALWVRTAGASDFKYDAGTSVAGPVRLTANSAGNHAYALNSTAVQSVANAGTTAGLLMADRSVSTTVALYRNGVLFDSKADTSIAVGANPIQLLGGGGTNSSAQILFFCCGSSLSGGSKALDLYNLMNGYKTSIGA